MTTGNTGSAREVAPGRLAHFEDSDEPADLPASTGPLLPPRRRRGNRPDTAAARPAQAPAGPAHDSQGPAEAPPVTQPPRAPMGPQRGLKGPEDRVRASNVHIPVALLAPIEAKCKTEGLSHGEVIIVAIESTHPRLADLIHPVATAGGNLFASRRSRASRGADGPLTPLNYRLREADFTTLDQLVEDLGASSRGHLITAALKDYFHP